MRMRKRAMKPQHPKPLPPKKMLEAQTFHQPSRTPPLTSVQICCRTIFFKSFSTISRNLPNFVFSFELCSKVILTLRKFTSVLYLHLIRDRACHIVICWERFLRKIILHAQFPAQRWNQWSRWCTTMVLNIMTNMANMTMEFFAECLVRSTVLSEHDLQTSYWTWYHWNYPIGWV